MNELEQARSVIDQVDREMAELFCRRMEAVRQVARYKQERGLPVLDEGRERLVIEKNAARVEDDALRSYYTLFLQDMMRTSRRYQQRLMEGMLVAYSGVEGAFAHIAAGRIFPSGVRMGFGSFAQAYEAVVRGECDCAVLPIENSYAGEVGQVIDLIFSGPLHVNGVYDLTIHQNLIGLPGSRVQDIQEVVSHPQALGQCDAYIARHGFRAVSCGNTAMAAQEVARDGDPTRAAIASEETAALYGLEVLEANINQSGMNTTRFAVLSRVENTQERSGADDRFILVFTVKNEAGALARAVNIIGAHGFNMRVLRSRAMRDLLWQYYFFVEGEGAIHSAAGRAMLEQLDGLCDRLRVLGTYRSHSELKDR